MRDRLIFTSLILWGIAAAVSLTLLLAVPLFYIDIHLENLTPFGKFDPDIRTFSRSTKK